MVNDRQGPPWLSHDQRWWEILLRNRVARNGIAKDTGVVSGAKMNKKLK